MKQVVLYNGKYWTKEDVKQSILTSDKALYAALLRVYEHQTADEQRADITKYVNGEGFNGSDALILSSFAKQLEKSGSLSIKQIAITRKKMVKYAGQVFNWMVRKHGSVKTIAGVNPASQTA